jgi:hypothetical protein
MSTTDATRPMKVSEEGDREGLRLARAEGRALGETLAHMIGDIAENGGETQVGEYLIGYAVEKAEGMYEWRDGGLVWVEPGDGNAHVEVSIRDAADGRFIPGLDVRVAVIDAQGRELGEHRQPLLWHPYLYHYGRNWHLPGSGRYMLRIRFDAPRFPRHDKLNGKRFAEGASCEFSDVEITVGQD